MNPKDRREAAQKFWGNPRVDAFESARGSDPLRGMPDLEFPYLVRSDSWTDSAGETWELRWLCTELQPKASGEDLTAKINVTFTTRLSPRRLSELGFDAARLAVLADDSWNRIRSGFALTVQGTLAALDSECSKRLSEATARIARQYPEAEKAAALRNALRTSLMSRFAE